MTTFGLNNTVTKTNQDLNDLVRSLSYPALSVLQHVAERLNESELGFSTLNPEGVYTEYDSSDCKPFTTAGFEELVETGLVSVHPASEFGCAFLNMNRDVLNAMVSTGNFTLLTA